jgi:TPR repeat protein
MKKLLQAIVMSAAMLVGSVSGALADFESGKKAYEAKNYRLALPELRKAASEKDDKVEAIQALLDILLFNSEVSGVPIEEGYREAIDWALVLDKTGNRDAPSYAASFLLTAAAVYLDGDMGLPLNYKRASELVEIVLLRLRYIRNDDKTQANSLGEDTTRKILKMLSKGTMPSNRATDILENFARTNIELPQRVLGLVFEDGIGGIKADYVKAHMWYSIAASNGSDKGRHLRKLIEASMRPTQITKSQKMAHEWKQKHSKK